MEDLSYLRTEYAREKEIESYRKEEKETPPAPKLDGKGSVQPLEDERKRGGYRI